MRAARQPAQILERAPRLLLIPFPQARQDFGDQPGGEERLVDGIMQVARQTLAFFQHRERLGMSIEFRIDHGDGGLVGYTQRQVGMMGREVIPFLVRHTHTADDAAFHRQRYPHPRLHPFEQHSRPIVQKRTQKLRLRVVTPHIGDADGPVPVEQRSQGFRALQVDAERRGLLPIAASRASPG